MNYINYYKDFHIWTGEKNLDILEVHEESLNGCHIKNKNMISKGNIITFGGSEGGSYYDMAKIIANHGYEVLALYFFGKPNQPKLLNRVPIEFFDKAIEYIKCHFDSKHPLTIVSASKGAELALVLSEYYTEIDNLILIAPSVYRFQGLDVYNSQSSWILKGKELPYISFERVSLLESIKLQFRFIFKLPQKFRPYYESAVKNAHNREEARIRVDNFQGKILMLVGQEDGMWNSHEMALMIKEQNPKSVDIVVYPNVGHAFGVEKISKGYFMGGDNESNKLAFNESIKKIISTLKQWYSK